MQYFKYVGSKYKTNSQKPPQFYQFGRNPVFKKRN